MEAERLTVPSKISRHHLNHDHANSFWDFERVLLVGYLPRGHTITGQYYAKLLPKVCQAIKEKRRGKLRRSVLFHQDNLATLPHTKAVLRWLLFTTQF
jgi:hypothetical protein